MTESTSERLALLSRCAMEIAMGNFAVQIPIPEQEDELTEITTALELMRQDIEAMVQRLREQVEKERTIAAQAATIRELSTPVIEVWDRILSVPLVGTIDTSRARQLVDQLLTGIAQHQAHVVIVDVTGVPVVDTQVANLFVKMVQAARLLGAEVVLTGLSPQSAQTIVKLGIDLSSVTTTSSLRAGLQLAFGMLSLELRRKE